jgi:IS5 family transposase
MQMGLSDCEQGTAKKRTNREKFLAEMDKVVPWQPLTNLIEPFYPKTSPKGGRPLFSRQHAQDQPDEALDFTE